MAIDLEIGARLIRAAAERAAETGGDADAKVLSGLADDLGGSEGPGRGSAAAALRLALDAELGALIGPPTRDPGFAHAV